MTGTENPLDSYVIKPYRVQFAVSLPVPLAPVRPDFPVSEGLPRDPVGDDLA